MNAHILRVFQTLKKAVRPEQLETSISVCSTRPAPLSEQGKVWEHGARWGWEQAVAHVDAVLQSPETGRTWQSVEQGLPPSGQRVLFAWKNALGERRTATGRYVAPRTLEETAIDLHKPHELLNHLELDEATGSYFVPAGWHEQLVESDEYFPVLEPVTHWQPLPETPEEEAARLSAPLPPGAAGLTPEIEHSATAAARESDAAVESVSAGVLLGAGKDVFRFTRDEMVDLLGRRFLMGGIALSREPRDPTVPYEPEYVVASTRPDVALLASMATCLHHGFGGLNAKEQGIRLADMRKAFDEVVGNGYYRYESRSRYLEWLAKEHGGNREWESPTEAGF